MARFHEPDLISSPDSPFVRDSSNRLVRRSYWLDMDDRALVAVMTMGIGAHLTNDEKRAISHNHQIFSDSLVPSHLLPATDGITDDTWRSAWPVADVGQCAANVRFSGVKQTSRGHDVLSTFDPCVTS